MTGVGTDETYFVENEWAVDDNEEWDESQYTQKSGAYVRMKRLLPGEQAIMSVSSTLYNSLNEGDTVQPAAGGTVAKYTAPAGSGT